MIATKLRKKNFSSFNLYVQIFFTSSFFGFGILKLYNDFENVFIKQALKLNVWTEIIHGLELLIFMFGTVAITVEYITELKFREKKEALTLYILQSILPTGENNLQIYFAIFYSFSLIPKIICHTIKTNESDNYRFFLKLIGQCFLIGAKLKFSTTVVQVKRYFKALNDNLTEGLRNSGKFTIQFDEIEKDQKRFLNFYDHCNTHWEVCKFVEIINKTFGLRLTFIIINKFHNLMFIPYLLAFNLLKIYLENRISVFMNILLLCHHAAEMLLLAFLADSATSEANNTEIILCRHLELSISEEDIEEIALYLEKLQIHEANFKIFSLFHLNKHFIISMLGAVTTYTIIFIQLQETLKFNISN